MKIFKSISEFDGDGVSVAIGKFNGIHKGHMLLIDEIVKDEESMIFVFDKNSNAGKILDEFEEKNILEEAGIKYLLRCPITEELMSMTPEAFVKDILVKKLKVKKVVCGNDFCFGKNRSGDSHKLKELGRIYGFDVVEVNDCIIDGTKVSSSIITTCLQEGNIETVNKFLGREYTVDGIVVTGRKLGRTLDFPTINIIPPKEKLLPTFGVYYTKVEINGIIYDGVTNVGNNPTICEGNGITIETHLLGINDDFYGKAAKVRFYKFARKQMRFQNILELKEQINRDANGYRATMVMEEKQ